MAVSTEEYLVAANLLLERLERESSASAKELEALRKELVRDIRNIAAGGVGSMRMGRVGGNLVLVPTSENFRRLKLMSDRVEERFTKFRVKFLSGRDIGRSIREGSLRDIDKATFVKHSNRLARQAKVFLKEIQELEPSLEEEINETLAQIEDNRNDLIKLEVKSWTAINETIRRAIQNRSTRAKALKAVRTFDIDKNLWNLSVAQHPKATVRALLANASERMAERVVENRQQIPKRAFVFAAAGPQAIERTKKQPGSRTSSFLWRTFSSAALTTAFAKAVTEVQGSGSSWRGLGLGFNTPEIYVPIPPENMEEVETEIRARRTAYLADVREEQGQARAEEIEKEDDRRAKEEEKKEEE